MSGRVCRVWHGVVLALGMSGVLAAEITTAPPQLEALMAQLAQRKHGHITYVEEHFIGALERPLQSSGELFYDAPGRLEKRTLLPKAESVILENGTMTARRARRTFVVNIADYPQVASLVDSIRSVLAGDLETLQRLFRVDWEGETAQWRLLLTPKDPAMGRTVREIQIQGEKDHIHTVEIRQADGDRSVLTLGTEIP